MLVSYNVYKPTIFFSVYSVVRSTASRSFLTFLSTVSIFGLVEKEKKRREKKKSIDVERQTILIFLSLNKSQRQASNIVWLVSAKNSVQKRREEKKRNRSMFGQKSREKEMYISEHVAYIRHWPTTVGCDYIYKLSLVSTFLFFLFNSDTQPESTQQQNNV